MKKLQDILTDKEKDILLSIPSKRYPTGIRNYCIMLLQVEAGLRISEVIGKEAGNKGGLRLRDIDLQTGETKIRNGKGGKDRIVWLKESILESLRKWKAIRPESKTDYFFTTLKGGKINNSYTRNMMKRYVKRAEIKKDIHNHSLRHTFATNFYNSTKDLRVLQKIIGHTNLKSTQIYTHISSEDVREAMLST